MQDNPVAPDDLTIMQYERPDGNYVAADDGTWVERDRSEDERSWAMSELALTDRCLTPDFPITDSCRQQITEYRRLLRNPARSDHPDYPNPSWRPTWPEGVKRPAG